MRTLPKENLRDFINDFRLDVKFRYVPFRGYYRHRSYKYMRRIDPEMGLLKFIVNPKRICLDVGANLGLFTYFLSRYSLRMRRLDNIVSRDSTLRSSIAANLCAVAATRVSTVSRFCNLLTLSLAARVPTRSDLSLRTITVRLSRR